MTEHFLLVSVVGSTASNLLLTFTKRVHDAGCNFQELKAQNLGQECALFALLSGTWDAIAKLESALARLAREEQIGLTVRRTQARTLDGVTIPYMVEVIASDRPGLIHQVNDFFLRRGVAIEAIAASRYRAHQTGAEMFSAQITIGIPTDLAIAHLRDEFLEFCDHLNLDAILDPIKG